MVRYYPTNFPFNVPLVAGEKPPFPPLYGLTTWPSNMSTTSRQFRPVWHGHHRHAGQTRPAGSVSPRLGRKAPEKKRYLSFFQEMSMSVNS